MNERRGHAPGGLEAGQRVSGVSREMPSGSDLFLNTAVPEESSCPSKVCCQITECNRSTNIENKKKFIFLTLRYVRGDELKIVQLVVDKKKIRFINFCS